MATTILFSSKLLVPLPFWVVTRLTTATALFNLSILLSGCGIVDAFSSSSSSGYHHDNTSTNPPGGGNYDDHHYYYQQQQQQNFEEGVSNPYYIYDDPSTASSFDYHHDLDYLSSYHHYNSDDTTTTTTTITTIDNNKEQEISPPPPPLTRRRSGPFRLISWNLLAPCYAPSYRHPWSLPQHLDWSYRKSRIVETLFSSSSTTTTTTPAAGGNNDNDKDNNKRQQNLQLPDIICLQEVQVDLWETDLKPAIETAAKDVVLSKLRFRSQSAHYHRYLQQLALQSQHYTDVMSSSYTTMLQKVNKKKPIANAILLRNGFAKCLKVESRSRAVIAVLEILQGDEGNDNDGSNTNSSEPPTQQRLIVANVHLQAGEQEYHQMQRYYQIISLFKRIDKLVKQYSTTPTTPTTTIPVIMVGDFNMTPDNPLIHLLRYGYLPSSQWELANPEYVATTYENLPIDTNDQELLSKYLPMLDTYRECTPNEGPQVSTYMSGDVIDYLWTSTPSAPLPTAAQATTGADVDSTSSSASSIMVHETWQSHPDARLDTTGMFVKGKRYPNDETPSDHLPIAATMEVVYSSNTN